MVNFKAMYFIAFASLLVTVYCAPTSTINRAERGPEFEVRNYTFVGPREEARAVCSVRTLEGNATANVTISRRLHNVVTPRELHTSMQRLEFIIDGQMQQLWRALDGIRQALDSGRASHVPKYPDRNKFIYSYYLPAQ